VKTQHGTRCRWAVHTNKKLNAELGTLDKAAIIRIGESSIDGKSQK
jgi:hypothetical protein